MKSLTRKVLEKHVMEDIYNLKNDIFKLWPERPTEEEKKIFDNCIIGLKGLQDHILKNSEEKPNANA